MLNINISNISAKHLNGFLKVKLGERLRELKSISTEEELLLKFPTISGIYQTKKDHISKSISLEQGCRIIKPTSESEYVKGKKLQEFGISRNEHANNLIEAHTFSLTTFLCEYAYDLERIITYLDFIRANITQSIMPISMTGALDSEKLSTYVKEAREKQRGLI